MTIDTIFSRFEIPEDVQHVALSEGAFVMALQENWVGPDVQWPRLIKAAVFSSLGPQGPEVRKKIGLDKYIVTLVSRGVPKFANTIADSHDVHQILYAYVAWRHDTDLQHAHKAAWERISDTISHNLLAPMPLSEALTPERERALRAINILHYKNPSV